ncbi:MAG: hypothetical protein AAF962_06310 [Actinomycetota bacterium]
MRRDRRRTTLGFSGFSAGVAAVAVAMLLLASGCGDIEVSVNGQSVNDLLEGGPEQLCGVVDALSLDRQALLDSGIDPEQLRSTWSTVDGNLNSVGDAVAFVEGIEGFQPLGESVDIQGQWPLVVAGFEERLALLEEAGFDPAALDERFDAVSTPEVRQARDSLSTICP